MKRVGAAMQRFLPVAIVGVVLGVGAAYGLWRVYYRVGAVPPPAATLSASTLPSVSPSPGSAEATTPEPPEVAIPAFINRANRQLTNALLDSENNWDALKRYWCGPKAWYQLSSVYKEQLTAVLGTHIKAQFDTSDAEPPVLQPDGTYLFSQIEAWFYTSLDNDRPLSERSRYSYVLRETTDPDLRYCIVQEEYYAVDEQP